MGNKKKMKFKKLETEEKYTSNEIPISQIESRRKEQNDYFSKLNLMIEQSINYLYDLNQLESELFYFIHINWHCTMICKDKFDELNNIQIFYPCEIAIVEFNLKDGMKRRFQKFINPVLPVGYAAEALERSEKVHMLPINNELGENNLQVVYREIKSFLQNDGQHNASIPPLYTRDLNDANNSDNISMKAVSSVLKTLYFHTHTGANYVDAALSDNSWEKEFKVYPLSKLLYELGKRYTSDIMIDTSISDIILDKDPYMYHPGIACNLHEELDQMQYCSLSTVSRWAMILREFCFKEKFKNEKLYIPPIGTNASQHNPGQSAAATQQSFSSSSKTSQKRHEIHYPAMKVKDTVGQQSQPVFVHNSSNGTTTTTGNVSNNSSTSNVNVGSAWCKPLVHHGPGIQTISATSNGNTSSNPTDNFPPLGGLKISNPQDDSDATGAAAVTSKKSKGKKKK